MAYLTITRISGDPDALLAAHRGSKATMDGVGREHGMLLHAAARTDDGVVLINLWPARANSEAAARDPRRLRTLQRTGITPDRLSREHHELDTATFF